MISAIPLLSIVIILYNVIALFSPAAINAQLFSLTLVSGANWAFHVSELLYFLAIILFYIELAGATRANRNAIINHSLSVLLFIVCILEFILVPFCGTSTFFVLMLFCLTDVVAGFTITIVSARRDVAFGTDSGNHGI